ncbi:L-cystine transporter [Endozoicomonas gorgoniicola]|uniref:L-cystine transporter n=1 Tax=Endozoicomonas gorgoniicola TaxID=1234144 RepID=A0ABT3MYY5_9GAMM|nr:L-cystine transporter [Endozoicomonas gorgoniicola]MCW7554591.1 L-cystine transporter [Endozoicomonas gorgoniicola]
MSLYVMLNIGMMLAMIYYLYRLQSQYMKFTRRVFIALGLGASYGLILHWVYGPGSQTITSSIEYIDIVGRGYVQLLRMIVTPLVMVSIITAILKFKGGQSLGKISGVSIGVLLFTVAIAGLIGVGVSLLFGLSAEGLTAGARELARAEMLTDRLGTAEQLSIASMLVDAIPANPFQDMAGLRSTSIISVVIFSAFIGLAGLGIHKKKPEQGELFDKAMEVTHSVVMRMVTVVLRLTPYGVLALMTKVMATSHFDDILNLINFVLASYIALLLMFVVHLILIGLMGGNPLTFVKKVIPVLSFAFTSRSSAGTIPLTVQTQTQSLGIPEGIANFAASFGATIGQNGCAGIYPAMLAVMIAPTVGINPMDISFIFTLIATIVVGSFGVAGVGGGATFAALIVLSSLNLPVALAGLLISIEPLIDMGRTALNVNGAITSGFVTSRLLGETDMDTYNSSQELEMDLEAVS